MGLIVNKCEDYIKAQQREKWGFEIILVFLLELGS